MSYYGQPPPGQNPVYPNLGQGAPGYPPGPPQHGAQQPPYAPPGGYPAQPGEDMIFYFCASRISFSVPFQKFSNRKNWVFQIRF